MNALYFIENPRSKYEDPFADDEKKKAIKDVGKAIKKDGIRLRIPNKEIYDGPMNYWEVIKDENNKRNDSSSKSDNKKTHEYVFVTFDKNVNLITESNKIIESETKKKEIYENVMRSFSKMILKVINEEII